MLGVLWNFLDEERKLRFSKKFKVNPHSLKIIYAIFPYNDGKFISTRNSKNDKLSNSGPEIQATARGDPLQGRSDAAGSESGVRTFGPALHDAKRCNARCQGAARKDDEWLVFFQFHDISESEDMI